MKDTETDEKPPERFLMPTPPAPTPPRMPASLKHQAVERWVARHLGAVDHEQRVAQIASTLFNLTWPLHQMPAAELKLLRLAAAVHDVGRSVDDDNHPVEGANMLLDDEHLPLSATERRLLAYLTLHHRGPVPAAGRDAILHRTDDADRLLHVLALLRAADTLDSRALDAPARMVFALVAAPSRTARRQLRATCYLATDCAKARRVYRRRKKFRLLEELLDVRVDVQIDHAEALRLVA